MASCTGDITYINWELIHSLSGSYQLTEIHQSIKRFIKSIDPDIKLNMSGNQFFCIIEDKLVNVPFTRDAIGDKMMYDFVCEEFGVSVPPFLMGLLHEVGHVMTYDEQIDKERSILYYMLQLDFDSERYEEFTTMYFYIPSEYAATEYAVNYYLSHKEYCDNFLKEIGYEA